MKSHPRHYFLVAICCLQLLGACTEPASPANPDAPGNDGSAAGNGDSNSDAGGTDGGDAASGGARDGSDGARDSGSSPAPADAASDGAASGDSGIDAPSPGKAGYLTCNPGTEGNGVKMTTSMTPAEWSLKAGVTAGTITPMASFPSTRG
jgi:hypothetical protein